MKKYLIFLERYLAIVDERERLAFMRGYMLHLSPKQYKTFFDFNIKHGISAIKELAQAGEFDSNSLDEVIALAQRVKSKYASVSLQVA